MVDRKIRKQRTKARRLMALATMLSAMLVGILTACSDSAPTLTADDTPKAIQFDTYLQKGQTTRTTYPSDTNKQGEITAANGKLKTTGFGVFASYYPSGDNTYTSYEVDKSAFKPNFMYNQEVTWSTDHWTYSPVKYWPNDYSSGDVGGGATGTGSNGQLAFFGYAPWVKRESHDSENNCGIVNISSNSTGMNHMYITYRVPSIKFTGTGGDQNYYEIEPVTATSSKMIDLLWAVPQFDKTKQKVGETVTLLFKHALSKLNIQVQGAFDDTDGTNTKDANTKILIESVSLSDIVLPRKAYMKLEPEAKGDETPLWLFNKKSGNPHGTGNYYDTNDLTRSLAISTINSSLLYTASPADPATTEAAASAFAALPDGVTNANQNLLGEGYYYLFPPNTYYDYNLDESIKPTPVAPTTPITVRIVYYVITYDPQLVLNTPKYFSIVKNDITRTLDEAFTFDAGKEYTLLLKLGMTSVKTDVEIVDWALDDGGSKEVNL